MNKFGANGEGFTARYNQADLVMIAELAKSKKVVVRFPGGSDAKNAHPSPAVVGLGMREDAINAFYDAYGKDENNAGRENDLQKLQQDQADDRSQLIDLVEICKANPNIQIIYCLNIFAEPTVNTDAINYLIDNGVDVIGIVAGNELYFTLNFEADKYIQLFTPHLIECSAVFPELPFGLCFGQDVNRANHRDWNLELCDFINQNSFTYKFAIDTHPYLATAELISALELHPAFKDVNSTPQGLVYSSLVNPELQVAFEKYNELWSATTYYDDCFNFFKEFLPKTPIWVSEFGCIPVEYWGNTLSNAAFYFSTFLKHTDSVDIFMLQNLQGNFFWAAMFDHVPHTSYYVLQLLQELGTNTGLLNAIQPFSTQVIEGEGEFYFPFVNLGETFNGCIVADFLHSIESGEMVFISAPYNYSTEGSAGFYSKKIEKETQLIPNDINGIQRTYVVPEHFTVVKNSLGYVKVKTKKRTIWGCTDKTAINYNPNANEDDGSCVYPPKIVKGCTDKTALNYNPEATEDDGSCTYPAPEIKGCTDPKAKNYNPAATCDDGSCKYRRKFVWWNPSSWFSRTTTSKNIKA